MLAGVKRTCESCRNRRQMLLVFPDGWKFVYEGKARPAGQAVQRNQVLGRGKHVVRHGCRVSSDIDPVTTLDIVNDAKRVLACQHAVYKCGEIF